MCIYFRVRESAVIPEEVSVQASIGIIDAVEVAQILGPRPELEGFGEVPALEEDHGEHELVAAG